MLTVALYFTAILVWPVAALYVLAWLYEGVRAVVACASWHQWAFLECRRRGVPIKLKWWPKSIVTMWWELLGHRKGRDTWTTKLCAEWRDIGDWNLGTALKVPGEE